MRNLGRVTITMAVAVAILIPALTAPAGADLLVNWGTLLPSVQNPNDPTNPDICTSGASGCVSHTISKMDNAEDPLTAACSDNSVFALTYLRTTQTYQWFRDQPGTLNDVSWVNYEDAVFGSFYFQAFNGWYSTPQNLSWVPQAWQIAFSAADTHTVTAEGNLLLGMNAHINADLPFVLYEIGLVDPYGNSRKPDHEAINAMLNDELAPLLAEMADKFDPNINPPSTPDGVGLTALYQLVEGWRESAWSEAEALANSADLPTFWAVAQSIQASAAAEAQSLVASNTYDGVTDSPASRYAYCMAHHNDMAPMAYPWGMPTASS
jgi:uncharacterized protein DUF5995